VSSIAYLLIAAGICLIGFAVVMYVHRRPRQGPHDSIDAFNRQLEVLGRFVDHPPAEAGARRPRRRFRARAR
jgi:hypothetical protein